MRSAAIARGYSNRIILGFFFSFFIVGVSPNFAQSLGDVAREKWERRTDESGRSHVYTNEDLSRSRIVIGEDGGTTPEAESASAGSNEPQPEQTLPRSSPMVWPSDIPLGDVARFYRRQRELESARESEFAVYEPPVLDMDFLLPSPLASPLLDFSETLPALPSIPEPAWDQFTVPAGTVRVQRGDTLWKIAERHLGSGKAWRKIAAANPELTEPNRIRIGQQLRLPAAETFSSGKLVRVQTGDSLWKLAAAQLGTGHAWICLAAANPQIENANRIYPGQLIEIPTDCPAGV